jgi:hypothetical protein
MDTFLLDLDESYKEKGLDLKEALDGWKESRFSAEQIQESIQSDINIKVSFVEAKFLQRCGKEIYEDNKIFASFYEKSYRELEKQTEAEKKLASSKIVKFTPEIKKAVKKIGKNTYRNKYGSIEWSIILVDGQPHLARRDFDDEDREKKAIPDSEIK